jgi:3-oxoacyl-[acyl-carrier-protein] synthase-1
MTPLLISSHTATSCIGRGLRETLASLQECRTGLKPCAFETVELNTCIGEVAGLEASLIPADLAAYDCRNNRLAQLGLAQDGFEAAVARSVERWGRERVGVFLGTSTSGILETELAYRHRDPVSGKLPDAFNYRGTHNSFSLTEFVRHRLGLRGPAAVICSACSSSAKVFGSARRMIEAGLIDAAVVGGVDSLCLTTLYGFHSLQLVSSTPCRPFDVNRSGISIGEAAAFLLLERAPAAPASGSLLLLGVGESSDAYHMSSPHPQGRGAQRAMLDALESAHLQPSDIDYINLHGTGTPSNDSAEGAAVGAVLGSSTPASSTKGATGHTLGAAGALEVVICGLVLEHGLLPAGLNTHEVDPALPVAYLLENRQQTPRYVMSNSFGFGGSNCSLVLGRA